MLRLCYKDYLASRWLWLSVAVLYTLYVVQPLGLSFLVMVFGAMAVYGALAITLIWEEQYRTEALYASLPLTRRQIVGGRYLLAGFILLAGAALVFGTAAPALRILKSAAYLNSLGPLLSVEAAVGYFLACGFLLAGFLPLYYRFGLAKGTLVLLCGLFALGLVVTGVEKLAARTFHLIPPLFTPDFFKNPGAGLLGLIGSIREAVDLPLFIVLTFIVLAALALASFRLSVRIYEKREL